MKITIERYWLYVNPEQPVDSLLVQFKVVDRHMFEMPILKRYRKYNLGVDLVTFDEPLNIYKALQVIADMKDRRFLTPFELLSLDRQQGNMQYCFQVITDTFALGLPPAKTCENSKRDRYGHVLSWREDFDGGLLGPSIRFATAPFVITDQFSDIELDVSKTPPLKA